MRARIRPTLSTALVASLLLGGCTATPDGATPASPPADAGAPAAAPTVDVDGFTPASPAPPVPANGMDNQDDDDQVDASSAAPGDVIPSGDSITPAVAAKAELTAAAFVRAFTRKDVTGTGWADGYTAYLTPYSQTAYAGTAQSSVPGTRVTGSAALAEQGTNTMTSATITVPTDAGTYQVLLLATNTGDWLVQRAPLPGDTP